MEDFGKRLKEERERLEMTQDAFAKACGVGRTAQFNYEREERRPTAKYLSAIDKIGGDANYVMTGIRKSEDWIYASAYKGILHTIEWKLGLKEDELEKIVILDVKNMRKLHFNKGEPTGVDTTQFQTAVVDWLKTASNPELVIDFGLFSSVVANIDEVSNTLQLKLTPTKKANIASILYRSFKKSGTLDKSIIEDTVKLAAT